MFGTRTCPPSHPDPSRGQRKRPAARAAAFPKAQDDAPLHWLWLLVGVGLMALISVLYLDGRFGAASSPYRSAAPAQTSPAASAAAAAGG